MLKSEVTFKMPENEARLCLLIIDMRQRHLRKVAPECAHYQESQSIEVELERLKMKLVGQLEEQVAG